MAFQFFPQGLPISSSFAISSSLALKSDVLDTTTAVLAGTGSNLIGPMGPYFVTASASATLIVA